MAGPNLVRYPIEEGSGSGGEPGARRRDLIVRRITVIGETQSQREEAALCSLEVLLQRSKG